MTGRENEIVRYVLVAFAAGLLIAAGVSYRGADPAPPGAVEEAPEPSPPPRDSAAADEARALAQWEEARRAALVEVAGSEAQAKEAAERWRREAAGSP